MISKIFGLAFGLSFCFFCNLQATESAKILSFADSCYAHRADNAKGDKADRALIDSTIAAYQKVLKDTAYAERAALGLMRSEYFRIRFASKNEKEKIKLAEHAKLLGDTLHAQFPLNREITSIYATFFSMWSANIGPLKAVKQGAAARVRDLADSAGDYQILGRAHQLLPYIPIILPWPEKKLAYHYLHLSLEQKPEDLYTYWFLAELYTDDKEYEKAEALIQQGLARGVRTDYFLEDKRGRYHLKDLQKKIDKKKN